MHLFARVRHVAVLLVFPSPWMHTIGILKFSWKLNREQGMPYIWWLQLYRTKRHGSATSHSAWIISICIPCCHREWRATRVVLCWPPNRRWDLIPVYSKMMLIYASPVPLTHVSSLRCVMQPQNACSNVWRILDFSRLTSWIHSYWPIGSSQTVKPSWMLWRVFFTTHQLSPNAIASLTPIYLTFHIRMGMQHPGVHLAPVRFQVLTQPTTIFYYIYG